MPIGNYQANFTAGIIVAGFDIKQSGYGESNTANATIRPIPWANPPDGSHYAVVIQSGGLQQRTRPYRATVWAEADYLALRALVGQLGSLTTPREAAKACFLNSVKRGDIQAVSGTTGPQNIELEFVMVV